MRQSAKAASEVADRRTSSLDCWRQEMCATLHPQAVRRAALAASALLLVAGESAAQPNCYRVYDDANRLVYEGRQAPVDLSDGSSGAAATLPRAGGGSVVWFPSSTCRGDDVDASRSSLTPVPPGTSPNAAVLLRRIPEMSNLTRGGGGDAGGVTAASSSSRGGSTSSGYSRSR
jgi:hypothetical protein